MSGHLQASPHFQINPHLRLHYFIRATWERLYGHIVEFILHCPHGRHDKYSDVAVMYVLYSNVCNRIPRVPTAVGKEEKLGHACSA